MPSWELQAGSLAAAALYIQMLPEHLNAGAYQVLCLGLPHPNPAAPPRRHSTSSKCESSSCSNPCHRRHALQQQHVCNQARTHYDCDTNIYTLWRGSAT